MKRLLCLTLVIATLFMFSGCQNDNKPPQSTVTVYYKAANITFLTQDGVVAPYDLDATGHETDNSFLLNAYLTGQVPDGFVATFPAGTTLKSLNLDGLTAKIVLDDAFATLKGLDLSIACACLTRTVISLTGCHEVIISAETTQLDGKNFITLTQDSYLLLDTSANQG